MTIPGERRTKHRLKDEVDRWIMGLFQWLPQVDGGRRRERFGSRDATNLPRSVQRAANLARLESADYQLL